MWEFYIGSVSSLTHNGENVRTWAVRNTKSDMTFNVITKAEAIALSAYLNGCEIFKQSKLN